MTWSPLQLRNLVFLGPIKPLASLDFAPGVNVICGASDTGKSFLVEALDFLLGGSKDLRDIPERVGYDRARIGIEASGKTFTLQRSLEGGDFRRFEGLVVDGLSQGGVTLRAKHSHDREDNLSGWLLSQMGLRARRIRKNQGGDTQSLSFRDLVRLVIVQENEIIKQGSPFWTGQYVNRTSEYSVLKLLLTGVDDSALVPDTDVDRVRNNASAKVELIDQWLNDLNAEIELSGMSRQGMEAQLDSLHESIESQRVALQRVQQRLDHAISERRQVLVEREGIGARIDEIKDLLVRFVLLRQHYEVDVGRLAAIEESGSLFAHVERVACPLCGAAPGDQHLDRTCGGDVNAVIEAARAETQKIKKLGAELQQTVNDLQAESKELSGKLTELGERYDSIDSVIRDTISPDVGSARSTFSDLVEKQGEVKRQLDLFIRLDQLENQRAELLEETIPGESKEPSHTDLSKTVLDVFSQRLEEILKAWHFPGLNRVYFDENTTDFVIDGKPRGSGGKGLRAITHAACSIALMEYCREEDLPHPGFVVLDSPLLAYWKPEGVEDNLQGTDLKDRFYEYLASNHRDDQVIIIENEHPPQTHPAMSVTVFTKNEHYGRYGFFPI